MNKLVPEIGAVIAALTVFLFAVCMIVKFHFGSYLVCMFLPIGYIMTALTTFFSGLSIQGNSNSDKLTKSGLPVK